MTAEFIWPIIAASSGFGVVGFLLAVFCSHDMRQMQARLEAIERGSHLQGKE